MLPKFSIHDVSVIICTKNAEKLIGRCLRSLDEVQFREIILVDASSTDGTQEIARNFGCRIVEDLGKGLGAARNLGVMTATGTFVLNFGPDNTTSATDVEAALRYLRANNHAGVSFVTRVSGTTYLERALDFWRRSRFTVGPAMVIGTPSLFYREILVENPFDSTRHYSDDGELCDRLSRLGHSFAISNASCDEHGKASLSELLKTWKLYGSSDGEHFRSHRHRREPLPVLLRSLTHPFRVELRQPLFSDPLSALRFLPILMLMVGCRYWGWFRWALANPPR
jgi:glycosyltransferase involved in cell wall biosynthesis